MTENEIGKIVVDAAVAVHRALGPGLLESVYEAVLAAERRDRGLRVERQTAVPIEYRGIRFDEGFRADLIVEGKILLELKSVERTTHTQEAAADLPSVIGTQAGIPSLFRRRPDHGRHGPHRERPRGRPLTPPADGADLGHNMEALDDYIGGLCVLGEKMFSQGALAERTTRHRA